MMMVLNFLSAGSSIEDKQFIRSVFQRLDPLTALDFVEKNF